MVTLDETEHVELVEPLCPWCEQPLSGRCDSGLHEQCTVELADALGTTMGSASNN